MTSEVECRDAAEAIVGKVVARVIYVGLTYPEPDETLWDYGDWHWPEVGVEFTTTDGSQFFGIWDSKVTQFELTFGRGPISQEWLPLQEIPPSGRAWEVTTHPRWSAIVGETVAGYRLAFAEPDDPPVRAPVAIRLETSRGYAWLVAAAPRDAAAATEDLRADGVYLGHDELIVLFDDDRAHRIGLVPACQEGGTPSGNTGSSALRRCRRA